MKRQRLAIAIGIPLVAVAILAVTILMPTDSLNPLVPHQIVGETDFAIYYPKDQQAGYSVPKSSIKYDVHGADGDPLFSFMMDSDRTHITVSEQGYPEALIYEKLTNTFLNPRTVGTSLGDATIGQPHDQPDAEVAVIKAGNTLIFLKPTTRLSNSEWKHLLDSLEVIKS